MCSLHRTALLYLSMSEVRQMLCGCQEQAEKNINIYSFDLCKSMNEFVAKSTLQMNWVSQFSSARHHFFLGLCDAREFTLYVLRSVNASAYQEKCSIRMEIKHLTMRRLHEFVRWVSTAYASNYLFIVFFSEKYCIRFDFLASYTLTSTRAREKFPHLVRIELWMC